MMALAHALVLSHAVTLTAVTCGAKGGSFISSMPMAAGYCATARASIPTYCEYAARPSLLETATWPREVMDRIEGSLGWHVLYSTAVPTLLVWLQQTHPGAPS